MIVNQVSQIGNINTEIEIIINNGMEILEYKMLIKKNKPNTGTEQKRLAC